MLKRLQAHLANGASNPFRSILTFTLVQAAALAQTGYAGTSACTKCHMNIGTTQSTTAMANTWHGGQAVALHALPGGGRKDDFEIQRQGNGFAVSVMMPSGAKVLLPVEAMVGGGRHGVSFLERVKEVDGIALERPALVEARYAFSPDRGLVLSAGFSPEPPETHERALGRVLSPGFEKRCLTCHGQPGTLGAGSEGGVRCESCHGPSALHAAASNKPPSIHGANSREICAQCHTGLSIGKRSDLVPDDLLVSSQVPALQHSECFIQSGGSLACTNCHNPHNDAAGVMEATVKTCLGCHSIVKEGHAGICPVNQVKGCVGCHMPGVERTAFHVVDHWIRVHPEQGVQAAATRDLWRTQVTPKREYLQIIVVEGTDKVATVQQRLAGGDPFRSVAHDLSIDATAQAGGFIGEMELAGMDSALATIAARLPYGGTSQMIQQGTRSVVLHRLARDFKYDANRLFQEAIVLKSRGDLKGAIQKDQQALHVYPYFLRALIFMGTCFAEAGLADRASEMLGFAAQSYPEDAAAQFSFALAPGRQPARKIEALRRAIELDPDLVAAYQSLGVALYAAGEPQSAIAVFHQGLQIDPLSAVLNYNLGLALKEQGDYAGSAKALKLALALDPAIASRQAN